jgi:type I restriction enzyme S subunit
MEVKPGYKQTEIGVIPEDWDATQLGKIGEALIGLTYKPSNVREHGTLVLRSSNIQNDALAFDDNVFVDIDIPERIKVRLGDVLVCVRNGSRNLIGKSVLLDERVNGMTFGAFMAVYRSPIGRLASFLFQSEILKRQINEHLGATINQITNKSLNSFRIPVPPTQAEQCAIAAALSDVDALLDGLDRLIAKKRDLKQAVMQQLLTGQTRLPGFHGEWEMKRLGEIGTFLKGSGVKKDKANSGELPCIRYGEIYTHHNDRIRSFNSRISSEVAATATRLRQGDLLFAGSGETKEEIGKCVAFVNDCVAFAGGDIVILRLANDANPLFMGYFCNTAPINAQKASRGQGDAVVHISAAALSSIEVTLPTHDEQTAIAAVLSDMDAELSALEARRDKTRDLKQAMMQELLTGKTRLVPAGAAHG